jgi:putative transposase
MHLEIHRNKLQRIYGRHDLHFITFSCHRRMPLLGRPVTRDLFEGILGEEIERFRCGLAGYVVMPRDFAGEKQI